MTFHAIESIPKYLIIHNISYGYLVRLKFTTKLHFIFPIFFIYFIEVGSLIRGYTEVKFRGQKYFHHQSIVRVDYEKNIFDFLFVIMTS